MCPIGFRLFFFRYGTLKTNFNSRGETRIGDNGGGNQKETDNLPVPVQQQLAAADGGVRRPPLPVVLARLRRSILAAEASEAVPLALQLYISGEYLHQYILSILTSQNINKYFVQKCSVKTTLAVLCLRSIQFVIFIILYFIVENSCV